jgi:hypothetical protein
MFDCWWEEIDIRAFVADNFSEEIQKTMVQPPKSKMLSLLELIEQARARNSEP